MPNWTTEPQLAIKLIYIVWPLEDRYLNPTQNKKTTDSSMYRTFREPYIADLLEVVFLNLAKWSPDALISLNLPCMMAYIA